VESSPKQSTSGAAGDTGSDGGPKGIYFSVAVLIIVSAFAMWV